MHTCISLHGLKRSWRSCPRRVNAGNINTPSTHHPRRWNVTTLMVGLKKQSHMQKSHPRVVNPRDIAGERKKKKKKKNPVEMTLASIQCFICVRKQKCHCPFSSQISHLEHSVLPWPFRLFKLMLKLLHMISIQGRELHMNEFPTNLVWWTWLNSSLIPARSSLTYTQAHRVMRKLETVRSLWCYVAWSKSNFCE